MMMAENGDDVLILVRPSGELSIKSRRTRKRFQRRLVENLQDALVSTGLSGRVKTEWGRLWVRASSRAALDVVPRVAGTASISEIEAICKADLERIVEMGASRYADRVRGRRFAVRARRKGRHPFSSRDINYRLGAALDREATVDLDDPELTVYVEVRDETAYFFSEKIRGLGALPLGVEGRAVALISGGYDSAVAAWAMLKRGVALDYVFCNLAGDAYERAVVSVAKLLADEWSYGTRPRIHVVEFESVIEELNRRVTASFWQVILKRLMYRAAERIAHQVEADAIITGESVGQVSSQTLANLRAISGSVELPVLRPLVGSDKEEIIRRSRAIGTYPLSEKVREHCAIVPERPVTEATPEQARTEESRFDLAILERAVGTRRVLDLRSLAASDLVMPYLYTSEVPVGATVVDARSAARYDAWHYPGAEHRDYWELLREFDDLDRDQTYVLYCDVGLKTAHLAERMQRAGYEAYSFKGGAPALRQYTGRGRSAGADRESAKTP